MRRIFLIGVCCIAAQLATPASAHAWWEYIEAFSGPAFGWGWDIELRLVCFTASPGRDQPVSTMMPSAGLFFSACELPTGHIRKGSIDLGFHYSRSKPTPEFADGQQVTLIMLTPSYSWRMGPYVDAGTGGGVYWFTSPGFAEGVVPPDNLPATAGLTPFKGVVLEPIRFDLHFERKIRDVDEALLSGIVVRLGTYWFPGGFDVNAFGSHRQKPGEIQKRIGFFFDTEPFLSHCREKTKWYCKPFRG
jgi:hypothetical protein